MVFRRTADLESLFGTVDDTVIFAVYDATLLHIYIYSDILYIYSNIYSSIYCIILLYEETNNHGPA